MAGPHTQPLPLQPRCRSHLLSYSKQSEYIQERAVTTLSCITSLVRLHQVLCSIPFAFLKI